MSQFVRRAMVPPVIALAAVLACPTLGAATPSNSPYLVPWAVGPQKKQEQQQQKPIVLGDLNAPASAQEAGAPFDPCSPDVWSALPSALVADEEHGRGRQGDTHPPLILCSFTVEGQELSVFVGWAPVMDDLDRGEPTAFAGQVGAQEKGQYEDGRPRCQTRVDVENGFAAVDVLSTTAEPCGVARAVSEHIANTATA